MGELKVYIARYGLIFVIVGLSAYETAIETIIRASPARFRNRNPK